MKIQVAGIVFQCDNNATEMRARTLLTKEPGTIEWLRQVREGDMFWDIGANVGCYTLLAAKKGAQVIAFEPHLETAALLARNVRLNAVDHLVTIVTSALDSARGIRTFCETSVKPGSSGHTVYEGVLSRTAALPELPPIWQRTHVMTVQDAIGVGLPAPHLMKIDVDGNELRVLRGAAAHLSARMLRSVQVEMPTDTRAQIVKFMALHGLTAVRDHYTAAGQAALDRGEDPAAIVHNTIFERSTT